MRRSGCYGIEPGGRQSGGPGGAGSKQKEVRYLDIHEDDSLDETQLASSVKQASQLPGERM
jgi:hypothetical protein